MLLLTLSFTQGTLQTGIFSDNDRETVFCIVLLHLRELSLHKVFLTPCGIMIG